MDILKEERNMNIRIMLPMREIITIKSGLLRKLHQVLPTLNWFQS
jgi:hypothetical protein